MKKFFLGIVSIILVGCQSVPHDTRVAQVEQGPPTPVQPTPEKCHGAGNCLDSWMSHHPVLWKVIGGTVVVLALWRPWESWTTHNPPIDNGPHCSETGIITCNSAH